jgi:hypothetical protein
MHSLHVGHVGLMGNLHYLEILDFVLGWPGWDICRDDKATWLAEQELAKRAVGPSLAQPPPRVQAGSRSSLPKRDTGPLDAQP